MTSFNETGNNDATPKNDESQATQGIQDISGETVGEKATTDAPAETPNIDPPALTLDDITGVHTAAMDNFDPSRHAVDSDGNPRKKRDGSFALKRGRKGAGVETEQKTVAPNTSGRLPPKPAGVAASVSEPAPAAVNYKAMAAALVGSSLGVAVMTLGDEWRPKDKAEFGGLVDATAVYLEAQDIKDIPPGWLLLSIVAAYSLPRITQPTTRSRIMAGWLRVKGLFARKKSVVAGE